MSKKVGIFSGSFNPIHNGHIAIARYMVEKEKFDEIWFIVSPQNPLKPQIGLLDDEIRADMTKLAIENKPTFRYCDIEMHFRHIPSRPCKLSKSNIHIQNYACSSDRIIGKFSTVGNLMMRSLKIIRYIYTRARDFRSKQRYSLLPYTLHTHP